ncbi:MAG: hypothetical protein K2Q10_12915, partial [Rhodospirillales bacterium]|nr:hypothetical protein [Rhodospirillales bacterium]
AADNGGDAEVAATMAKAAVEITNAMLPAIGDITNIPEMSFGFFQGKYFGGKDSDPFDVTKTDKAEDAITKGVISAIRSADLSKLEPEVASALTRSKAATLEDLGADLDFARTFGDQMDALKRGTVEFGKTARAAAEKSVEDAVDTIRKVLGKTEELGLDKGVADEATLSAARMLAGLDDPAPELTTVGKALENLKARAAAVPKLLDAVGYSAEEAATLAQQGFQKQLAAMRQGFNDDIDTALRATADPIGFKTDQENDRYAQQLKDAADIGGDILRITALHALKLAEINKERNKADDQAIQATQQQTERMFRLGERLRNVREELLVDQSLSPLSTEERRAEAFRRLHDATDGLDSVDPEEQAKAIEELPDLAEQALKASRDYYASSEDYYRDFQEIQGILSGAETLTSRQMDLAQRQLDELKAISSKLDGPFSGNASSNAALRAIINNPEILKGIDTFGRGLGERMPDSLLFRGEHQAIARTLGYTGDFNNGAHLAWMAADPNRRAQWDAAIAEAQKLAGDRFGDRAWGMGNYQAANVALA